MIQNSQYGDSQYGFVQIFQKYRFSKTVELNKFKFQNYRILISESSFEKEDFTYSKTVEIHQTGKQISNWKSMFKGFFNAQPREKQRKNEV